MKRLLVFWALTSGILLADDALSPSQKPIILTTHELTKEWAQLIANKTVAIYSTEQEHASQLTPTLLIETGWEETPTKAEGFQRIVLSDGLPLLKIGQELQPAACKKAIKEGERKPCCCTESKGTPKYEAIYTSTLEHAPINPYAWMDVSLSMSMVVTLTEALCDLMPQHAALYRKNSEAYLEALKALDEDIAETIDQLPRGKRSAPNANWLYFSRRYGLEPPNTTFPSAPDPSLKKSSYIETMKHHVESLDKKRPAALGNGSQQKSEIGIIDFSQFGRE